MHKCGISRCPSCHEFVDAIEHHRFLHSDTPKSASERLIFFDFETDQSSGEHLVNFAVAQ